MVKKEETCVNRTDLMGDCCNLLIIIIINYVKCLSNLFQVIFPLPFHYASHLCSSSIKNSHKKKTKICFLSLINNQILCLLLNKLFLRFYFLIKTNFIFYS
ncbi:hypothetical protein AAZX31_11G185200 [Glycine max]